jgi:hypothetical protein
VYDSGVVAVRNRLEFWARAAGLLATVWLVWATTVAPSLHRGYLPLLLVRVWWISSCALGWSIIMGVVVRLVNQYLGRSETSSGGLRASAVAVWYAPSMLLLMQPSPIPITSGVVLLGIATRLLCAPWGTASEIRSRHFLPALAVSFALQGAAVSLMMRHRAQAAGLFELGVAILIAVAIGVGVWTERRAPNLPRAVLGLALTVLLALLTQHLPGGRGWGFGLGGGDGESTISAAPPPPNGPQGYAGAPDFSKSPDYGPEYRVPGSYPGVILWPEVKPVTVLIAPPMPRGSGYATPAHPLSIPFGGEYWMYRFPLRRPPRNSFFKRGTPVSNSFNTTDRAPLNMEARQKLVQPIGTACCREIHLEIRNADPAPGAIRLELLLVDGDRTASLGLQPLRTSGSSDAPAAESVVFPFPLSPAIEQFDQIKVIFRRPLAYAAHSSRISIDRFVLIP